MLLLLFKIHYYFSKKKLEFFFLHLMQFFCADATIIIKKNLKTILPMKPKKKCDQKLLKISPKFVFQLPTSPNLNFCTIKVAHRTTYVHKMTLPRPDHPGMNQMYQNCKFLLSNLYTVIPGAITTLLHSGFGQRVR